MRTHYCYEEKDWITFEGECNWCGMKEEGVLLTTDEEFRQMMAKLEAAAKPDINDD